MAKASNKKVQGQVKLQVKAGQANPAPPIGPALGQQGVNIMEFCKAFNAQTQSMEAGVPLPVIITVYADKSFTFIIKQPPASWFIMRAAKLPKGGANPGRDVSGTITIPQLREIAEKKMVDMNANSVDAAVQSLRGTARAMGLKVVEE